MKKPGSTRNHVYMVRTTLALVLVALFFAVGGGILYVRNLPATKTFTSDSMKVQFDYPIKFEVNEHSNDISIKNNGGEISFGKSGTFYSNASEHVKFLSKTHLYAKTLMSQNINVNGLSGVKLLLDSQGDKKYEYIFVENNTLYQFETDDPSLFSDLDSIAKSFRIIP